MNDEDYEDELNDEDRENDEEMEESNGILLDIKDGVASIHKEPFATVEIPTEKDWNDLKFINNLKQVFQAELEATRSLVREGNPFTMTRKEYLDILENIWQKASVTKEPINKKLKGKKK